MADLFELKKKILEVVKDNNYDLNDLLKLLSPLDKYVNNELFKLYLKQVVDCLLEDRDGNKKFTVKDLDILRKDTLAVSSLISALLLVIGSIPEVKLKNDNDVTQELVLKLLMYVVLIVIPKETNNLWTYEEKENVITLVLTIYQLILSSQVTKDAFAKVVNWFKTRTWLKCKCFSNEQERRNKIVNNKLDLLTTDLENSYYNSKEMSKLNNQVDVLTVELNKLVNSNKVEPLEVVSEVLESEVTSEPLDVPVNSVDDVEDSNKLPENNESGQ